MKIKLTYLIVLNLILFFLFSNTVFGQEVPNIFVDPPTVSPNPVNINPSANQNTIGLSTLIFNLSQGVTNASTAYSFPVYYYLAPDSHTAITINPNGFYFSDPRTVLIGWHFINGLWSLPNCDTPPHLLEVCRYVVLNPVRARIKKRPEEWKWSSYRATAGQEGVRPCLTTEWVLGQFSRKREEAEKRYRQFVQEGIGKETIWKEVKGQAILGEEAFVEKLIDYVREHKDVVEIPKSQRYVNRPGLEKIFTDQVLQTRKKRNQKIVEAVEKFGYTQREIADHLGLYFTSVSRLMKQGV